MALWTKAEKIGSGGFGTVYAARREGDGRPGAIKYLNDGATLEDIARFRKEVRCLQQLTHPNVVPVLGVHLTAAPFFYVMPQYRASLAAGVHDLRGDTSRIRRVFGAVLDAVEYAHSQGIVHRDIKSENVLMNGDDDVVVSDFGLGLILDSRTTRLTRTGERMGTVAYAAPELYRDARAADARSDVFSLGRVLYELYAGEVTTTPDLQAVPGPISSVVDRATRPRPEDRFQTVQELRRAFEAAADVLLGNSRAGSLDTLIARLIADDNPTDAQIRELAEGLADIVDEPDEVHRILMRLPAPVFGGLARQEHALTRRLVASFAQYVRSQPWPFTYTDAIADVCSAFFEVTTDYEIRGEFLHAVLHVGVDHNRFHVMQVFGDLLARARDEAEALEFSSKLAGSSEALIAVRDYVGSPRRLSPPIRGLFEGPTRSGRRPVESDDLPF